MAETATKQRGKCFSSLVCLQRMPPRSTNIATNAISRIRNQSKTFPEEDTMAKKLKEVDAVMVGMGWTGAILARELTLAGLKVVGLERGPDRKPAEDSALP